MTLVDVEIMAANERREPFEVLTIGAPQPAFLSQVIDLYGGTQGEAMLGAEDESELFGEERPAIETLPGIAEIHIKAHRHYNSAVVIVDRPPVRIVTVVFPGLVRDEAHHTWHLKTLIQIIQHVEDRVFNGHLHHLAAWEDAVHGSHEHIQGEAAVVIIGHQKSAAKKVFAQALGLVVR